MVANGIKIRVNRFTVLGAIAALATTVGISATAVLSQSSNVVEIDGSSTVFPITEAIAEEFQTARRGQARVTVGISGTGGGFRRFCAGETDISNASRPIKASEMEVCRAAGIRFIELPIAYDALTVVINPQNTWAETMTVEELKKLWEPEADRRVTRWNQIRPSWPNAPIALYGPGTDSGTFDYFTEAIMGRSGSSRTDFTASEDDNVLVQGVQRDRNAIGYFGFAYYEANRNRLKSVSIDNGNGPVAPTREAIENGTYQPLGRPLFIYVNADSMNEPTVREFVSFYLDNVAELSAEVGYVPLPSEAYAIAEENVRTRKLGSVFEGRDTIGVRIADLLRLEAQE